MPVALRREIDAYQRALDTYQRSARSHNNQVDAYNNTLVTDPSGNYFITNGSSVMVADKTSGQVTPGQLENLSQYGTSAIEGDNNFRLLRQNPTVAQRQTITATPGRNSEGDLTFSMIGSNQGVGDREHGVRGQQRAMAVGPSADMPAFDNTPSGNSPGAFYRYEGPSTEQPGANVYSYDASTYMNKPGEFTRQAPTNRISPTQAQLRQLREGSMSQQTLAADRGLIGEVLGGKGVR